MWVMGLEGSGCLVAAREAVVVESMCPPDRCSKKQLEEGAFSRGGEGVMRRVRGWDAGALVSLGVHDLGQPERMQVCIDVAVPMAVCTTGIGSCWECARLDSLLFRGGGAEVFSFRGGDWLGKTEGERRGKRECMALCHGRPQCILHPADFSFFSSSIGCLKLDNFSF
jgi:hypothetical protein